MRWRNFIRSLGWVTFLTSSALSWHYGHHHRCQSVDIAYRMRFSSSAGGLQPATLRRVEGAQAAGANESGQAVVEGAPVSTGLEARVTDAGDYRSFSSRGGNLRSGDDFFADRMCAASCSKCPTLPWGKQLACGTARWFGGRHGRGLDPGGARSAAPATFPCPGSLRRGERCLPRRGAGERYRFRCRLRTCAGAYGWVYPAGSEAGGRDDTAGDPPL